MNPSRISRRFYSLVCLLRLGLSRSLSRLKLLRHDERNADRIFVAASRIHTKKVLRRCFAPDSSSNLAGYCEAAFQLRPGN